MTTLPILALLGKVFFLFIFKLLSVSKKLLAFGATSSNESLVSKTDSHGVGKVVVLPLVTDFFFATNLNELLKTLKSSAAVFVYYFFRLSS